MNLLVISPVERVNNLQSFSCEAPPHIVLNDLLRVPESDPD